MRVTTGRESGELTVVSSQVLHYMDMTRVQKFYQQMHLRYVSDVDRNGNTSIVHWAVSNWGPGFEAPWHPRPATHSMAGDLKGGIKVEGFSAAYMAENACARIIHGKLKKGYQHPTSTASAYVEADNLEPGGRLLGELGLVKGGLAKPAPVAFETRSGLTDESFLDLEETIGITATSVLDALASGDLPVAIAYRQELLDIMARMRTAQEGAAGRMEMLNAKLAEAIR